MKRRYSRTDVFSFRVQIPKLPEWTRNSGLRFELLSILLNILLLTDLCLQVYIPPYLTQGRTQPSFTLNANDKDWAYGSTHTITNLQIQGSISNVKVSLVYGESACFKHGEFTNGIQQLYQVRTETPWERARFSPLSAAAVLAVRLLPHPTQTFLRLVGTSCLFWMDQLLLIRNGCVLAVIQLNLGTGPTFLDLLHLGYSQLVYFHVLFRELSFFTWGFERIICGHFLVLFRFKCKNLSNQA